MSFIRLSVMWYVCLVRLFELQDKKFVYRVIEGKTSQTEIEVAPLDDGKSYIVEGGLNEGDIIIAEGAGLMKDGLEVEIQNN